MCVTAHMVHRQNEKMAVKFLEREDVGIYDTRLIEDIRKLHHFIFDSDPHPSFGGMPNEIQHLDLPDDFKDGHNPMGFDGTSIPEFREVLDADWENDQNLKTFKERHDRTRSKKWIAAQQKLPIAALPVCSVHDLELFRVVLNTLYPGGMPRKRGTPIHAAQAALLFSRCLLQIVRHDPSKRLTLKTPEMLQRIFDQRIRLDLVEGADSSAAFIDDRIQSSYGQMDSDEPDLSSFVHTFNPVGPRVVVIDDSDGELDFTARSDLLLDASVIDTATVQKRRAKRCLVCASSDCARKNSHNRPCQNRCAKCFHKSCAYREDFSNCPNQPKRLSAGVAKRARSFDGKRCPNMACRDPNCPAINPGRVCRSLRGGPRNLSPRNRPKKRR
jgi:hypothetical protein